MIRCTILDEFFSKVKDSNHKNFLSFGTSTSTNLNLLPLDLNTYGYGFLHISHSNCFQVYDITFYSSFFIIFCFSQNLRHSKWMNRTEPSHLHEFKRGFSGVCSLLQQTLHYMASSPSATFDASTTPQSISTASSSWKSFSLSSSCNPYLNFRLIGEGFFSVSDLFRSSFAYVLLVLKSLTQNLSLPNLMTSPLWISKSFAFVAPDCDFKLRTTMNIILLVSTLSLPSSPCYGLPDVTVSLWT